MSRITKIMLGLFLIIPVTLFSTAGKVYLVIGSDTAIWEGMSVSRYICHYNIDLYTNPIRNAYGVMNPAFRAQFTDSYGQPMKMTWWMMAGNIFRYADNMNMPIPNIMTLYLMQKYHGENAQIIGDEISLHYHTFAWTDYNQDGIYWWNQSLTFMECFDDFNFTLSQFLLEENVFPVSFRSGWHYMDNDWQHYLDQILPYSMHNAWPSVRTDTTEPLDNTYDWSLSPEEFVPFHPSYDNYQIPGDGPGWNVRSTHFNSLRYNDLMDYIFEQADAGTDQVACIWGHLPETDFLTNIEIIDSLAHKMANQYPEVKFRYCTAIEAMQRWMGTSDTTAPQLTIEEVENGDNYIFNITTDEPIFQPNPFVAVKNIYEEYLKLECESTGVNEWRTTDPIPINEIAKIGVTVCDSVGNQTNEFITFLPDDIYLDNVDNGYSEIRGNWSTSEECSWGLDSRMVTLSQSDTVIARWNPDIEHSSLYNIFVQIPDIDNRAENITYKIFSNGICLDTVQFTSPISAINWVYISTVTLNAGTENYLQLEATGYNQEGKTVIADVAKFSALVREYDLHIENGSILLGEVSQNDTIETNLKLSNLGYSDLIIYDVSSQNSSIQITSAFPLTLQNMCSVDLPILFCSDVLGDVSDTIWVHSNDSRKPYSPVLFSANVQPYFTIIDNEDSLHYREEGDWHYSNAEAYGPSSRYAWLNQNPRARAFFTTTLPISGTYEIFEIVPTTVNATDNAKYIFRVSNNAIDSLIINQNTESGYWVSLGQFEIPADTDIEIEVIDTGNSTEGVVLRADAIKIALTRESEIDKDLSNTRPREFRLYQNYPNPFNASTTIKYSIPCESKVTLKIFNTLGQEVETLVNQKQSAGDHTITWNANQYSSGMYFYKLSTKQNSEIKKLMLVR